MYTIPRVLQVAKKLTAGKSENSPVSISADTKVVVRSLGGQKKITVFYKKDVVFRGVSLSDIEWSCGYAIDGPWADELETAISVLEGSE